MWIWAIHLLFLNISMPPPENTHCKGKDHCTASLQSTRSDLTKVENMLLLNEPSQTVESYLDKLDTNRTVILPLTVSEIWS